MPLTNASSELLQTVKNEAAAAAARLAEAGTVLLRGSVHR